MMKNVTLHIKKNWLGSLAGCAMMGDAKEDKAQAAAGFALEPSPQEEYDTEDTYQQQQADEAIDNAMAESSRLHDQEISNKKVTGSSEKQPTGNHRWEDTADGIRDAWMEVYRADTEEEFFELWNQLEAAFPT